jgi:xylulokinase
MTICLITGIDLLKDVFDVAICISPTEEGASFGGAVLARYAWWRQFNPDAILDDVMMEGGLTCVAHPREDAARVYSGLLDMYNDCETQVMDIWRSKSEIS